MSLLRKPSHMLGGKGPGQAKEGALAAQPDVPPVCRLYAPLWK